MRKGIAVKGLFLASILLLGTGAAFAAGRCTKVCTASASCSLSCNAGTPAEPDIITCGDYGLCNGGPPPPSCVSNWVTSSAAIGGFAVQSFFPSGCDYYGVSRITKHDTNNCQADQVFCALTFHTFRSDLACCSFYWCGGDTCGYN